MKTRYLLLGGLLAVLSAASFAISAAKPADQSQPKAIDTNKVVRALEPSGKTISNKAPKQKTPKLLGSKLPAKASTPQRPKAKKPVVKRMWNLQDVDIRRVITEISRETGKNFVLDPQVRGKITIISSHPMGPNESYQVFLSSLRVLGFAVVPDGKNLKIVPSRDSANQARLATAQHPGVGDEAVVRAIPVHYVSAMQLVPALRPLAPTWANLTAYQPSNSIIVNGSAGSVQRIADIIAEVDTPNANGIDVIHLKHAVADDVVKEVNKLILAARANGASNNGTLSADTQSNSVLISGSETSRLRLKILIAKIDNADAHGNNNTRVIYLKYAQVKDILPLLKAMVHQSVSFGGSSGGASYASSDSSSSSSNSLGSPSPQFQAAVSSQLNNATLNSGAGANSKSKVTIVGDVTNNALIITADPSTMMRLRSVIARLDVRPKQVLVQGVIAEVDASTAKQLGIEWGTTNPTTSTTNSASGSANVSGPVSAYSYTGGMGVGLLKSGDMRALIALLASDANTNIVSTPSLTVLNNSAATIQVGRTISQLNGDVTTNTGVAQVSNSYSDKNVGLSLKVIPQVTGDNQVRLVISQQNSSVIDQAQTGSNPNKPISTEELNTEVMVDDGKVLVLGGLIDATDREINNRVPILGDIPLLGYLFRSHGKHREKRDLMIFLRPTIIRGSHQATQITEDRYDFMRDVAILNTNGHGNMIASSILASRKPLQLPMPFQDHASN